MALGVGWPHQSSRYIPRRRAEPGASSEPRRTAPDPVERCAVRRAICSMHGALHRSCQRRPPLLVGLKGWRLRQLQMRATRRSTLASQIAKPKTTVADGYDRSTQWSGCVERENWRQQHAPGHVKGEDTEKKSRSGTAAASALVESAADNRCKTSAQEGWNREVTLTFHQKLQSAMAWSVRKENVAAAAP